MADNKRNKFVADTITECKIDTECSREVDLKQCIESARCDDSDFCKAYDELRQSRLIARELIRLRKSKGLSRAELARAAGVSLSSISRLESPEDTRKNLSLLTRVVATLGAHLLIEIVADSEID